MNKADMERLKQAREIMHRWGKPCHAPIADEDGHTFECDAGAAAIIRALAAEREAEREACAAMFAERAGIARKEPPGPIRDIRLTIWEGVVEVIRARGDSQ